VSVQVDEAILISFVFEVIEGNNELVVTEIQNLEIFTAALPTRHEHNIRT
jgi:hypothetical protein